ncbi:anti-phage protein KwaB [Oceanospirillum sediminis]|uniref:DUF4868 domain-containing protein n=1 Tax=Oceanospirillum sediminis TaxID=2760088 RepID=A0A839IWG5_9GAMM|nr:DUF4868 domain-containing protein [Oceanospirillum sediminis]
MNTLEAKEKLKQLVDRSTGIRVYFVDEEGEIKDSALSSAELTDCKREFCASLEQKYIDNESFTAPLLSEHDDRKHALYQFDFDDQPAGFSVLDDAIELARSGDADTFQVIDNQLSTIKAVILILENEYGVSAGFYQHVYSVSLLNADRGMLNLTAHETRIIKLDQDVLKISPNFVFMKLGDDYLIENVKALESQLNFKKAIHEKAWRCTEQLHEMDLIDDLEKFAGKIAEETGFARKFVKVFSESAVIESGVTNEQLIEYAKNKDYYSEALAYNEAGDRFKLDTAKKCRAFLELLDDDLLTSNLTGRDYIARNKDRI